MNYKLDIVGIGFEKIDDIINKIVMDRTFL